MAEDLAQQRVERPWLVNLQWALALVCGAIAVWALTPSGPTAPCRDRLFRADGALPHQMRGATGPVMPAPATSPTMSPRVTTVEARCTSRGNHDCSITGSPGWATATPAASSTVPR